MCCDADCCGIQCVQHSGRNQPPASQVWNFAFFFSFDFPATLTLSSLSPDRLYQPTQHSIMPVISQKPPSIEVKETLGGKETPSLLSQSPMATEDSVENINKDKLANMKMMMKTYVLGALREKDQVSRVWYQTLAYHSFPIIPSPSSLSHSISPTPFFHIPSKRSHLMVFDNLNVGIQCYMYISETRVKGFLAGILKRPMFPAFNCARVVSHIRKRTVRNRL